MTREFAGYISGALILLSFAPYVKDIFRRTTKPQRASWLIWSVLNLIAFFSQFAKGASDSLWFSGAQAAGDLFVFALSVKYGLGGLARRDVLALTAAGVSLVLWYLTKEATVALLTVIVIDAIGLLLTVLKSYEKPATETLSSWVLTALGGFFAIISVGSLNLVLLAWPIYIFLAGVAVVTAIKLGFKAGRSV